MNDLLYYYKTIQVYYSLIIDPVVIFVFVLYGWT